MKKSKMVMSTFEREMKDPQFKKAFDAHYKDFLLSELLISIMEDDNISVRDLAKQVGISPTIIQKLRSGKQDDLKVSNFVGIVQACGYKLFIEKDNEKIEINDVEEKNRHYLNFTHL